MKAPLLPLVFLLLSYSCIRAQTGNVGIGTTQPTDQLHTTGTVRHEGYRGPGTRLVQMDSSGRMIVTGAGEIFSSASAVSIPNNGCGTNSGAVSSIVVGGQPLTMPSSKISVRVNITHPAVAELRMFLVAPGGQTLLLMSGAYNNGANLTNTVFTDAADANLSGSAPAPPFTGKFRALGASFSACFTASTIGSFAGFGGGTVAPNGTWTLKVYDFSNTNTNNGALNDWEISFSGPESFTTAEQEDFIPKFSEGNLVPSVMFQGTNGNIGIRDPSAPYPLTIGATGSGIVQRDNANGVAVGTYANAGGGWLQTYSNHPLLFTTNNSGAQMTLNTAGYFGVGISAASITARLHVSNTTAALLQLDNGTTLGAGVNNDIWFKTGTYYTGAIRTRGTGPAAAAMGFYTNGAVNQSALAERLTISDNGNVGIGNTAPFYKLDVGGSANIDGNITSSGNFSAAQVTTSGNTIVNGSIRVAGGSPAAGKVLTATSSFGDATWVAPLPKVSFRAYLPASIVSNSGYGFTLTGYTEEHDEGGGFNPAAGTFTAPVSGLYHFDVLLIMYNPSTTQGIVASVKLNNSGAARDIELDAHLKLANQANNTRISETMQLAAGDVISVLALSDFGFPFQVSSYPSQDEISSFSGYLVH